MTAILPIEVRVEHNRDTILMHLGGEEGHGWTVFAVDRGTSGPSSVCAA
jgi:hypothetical protein